MLDLPDHPLLWRVQPRLPLAGRGILDEPLPVPDQEADVGLVVEDPGSAFPVARDSGWTPGPGIFAVRRAADALRSQRGGERAGRQSGGIALKDAPNRGGLVLDDLAFPSGHRAVGAKCSHRAIAIADAARRLPVTDAAFQTAMCLLGELLEKEGRHRAAEADVHLVDLALGLGHDRHIEEAHALVQGCDMLLIARQPVERLCDNDVELAVHRGLLHRLDARPQVRGATHGLIGEDFHHAPAAIGAKRPAHADLVRNRCGRLQVARVPRVDRGADRCIWCHGLLLWIGGCDLVAHGLLCEQTDEMAQRGMERLRRYANAGTRRRRFQGRRRGWRLLWVCVSCPLPCHWPSSPDPPPVSAAGGAKW